ncbi:MAG: hypothetical protein WC412_02645 [Candidatus Omnitrophota bacterium]|jgi:cell division ATPase FtsA
MKGMCGLDIDKDKIYISLGHLKGSSPVFLQESSLDVTSVDKTFLELLQENGNAINQKICEKEKALSLTVEKIFVNLPWDACKQETFSATVPLAKRKKIAQSDINLAKKYLQDTYLDWDDFCIHNFILNYEIEGNVYDKPPLGIIAKKIKISSVLVWIKDKFRKDIEDVFDNLERSFGGLVYPAVSAIASVFTSLDSVSDSCIVIDVAYDKTLAIAIKNKKILSVRESNFGLKQIFEELEKKILLPKTLAREVFNRYISFRELSYSKEVSIKSDESYINLSTQAATSFVKDYIKNVINQIIEGMGGLLKSDYAIYFTGRLNEKEGFCDFVKEILPHTVGVTAGAKSISKSFGVLSYGVSRFFDNDYIGRDSFLNRIMNVYKEYF